MTRSTARNAGPGAERGRRRAPDVARAPHAPDTTGGVASGLPSASTTSALQAELAAWYAAVARDLPWRRTRDPYAIWISEAMLQQTRVETVVGYWQRFLAAFPTVTSLAEASEDQVLALWSGLGYYRRARALLAAARVIASEHGGRFPEDPEAVRALPGVGPYTAGAVLSIAYDLPEPVVDGNVARVLARLFALDAQLGSKAATNRLWELARALVPAPASVDSALGPGRWNQALMELGATVCLPRARCGACPLAAHCRALAEDRVGELPRKATKPEPLRVTLELLVARRGRRLLVERRPEGGRMAGLWQLPTRELVPPGGSARLFPAHWPPLCAPARGSAPDAVLGELTHGITKHRIKATLRAVHIADGVELGSGYRWCTPAELAALPRTGMTKKALALLAPLW